MKLPSQVAVRSTNQLSTEQSTSSRNEATTVISKPPVMNNLARWVSEPDVDDANTVYGAEKRHRGGRKNKKKHQAPVQVALTWDDIYDPLRPTLYEDYPHSDENIAELRAWKDKLHASQMAQLHSTDSDSNNGDVSNSESNGQLFFLDFAVLLTCYSSFSTTWSVFCTPFQLRAVFKTSRTNFIPRKTAWVPSRE